MEKVAVIAVDRDATERAVERHGDPPSPLVLDPQLFAQERDLAGDPVVLGLESGAGVELVFGATPLFETATARLEPRDPLRA